MKTTPVNDSLEDQLAAHVAHCRFDHVPVDAVASAKRSLIDTLAAMVAGRAAAGIDAMVALAHEWGGAPQARIIGSGLRAPAPVAAWCNGAMARALELDDCVDYLPIHPSAMSVPALLAGADAAGGLSGRALLCALAVAQDLKVRLGLAMKRNAMQTGRNNAFKIYAATAGVANAYRLAQHEVHHALGIASSYAVGDGQCAIDGSMALRVQYGNVAQGALHSVELARRGVTGARDFLSGRYGYLPAFEPEHDVQPLLEALGSEFRGATISTKPYAACRATHPAIDLARQLRMLLGGPGECERAIEQLQIFVTPEMDGLVGSPRQAKIRPQTGPAAQFSLQFTVATALLHDGFALRDSEASALQEADRLALAERVEVIAEATRRTASVLGRTGLKARLRDGRMIELEREQPSGSPEHPVDTASLRAKFLECAAFSGRPITVRTVDTLIEQVATLESCPDVRILIEALA